MLYLLLANFVLLLHLLFIFFVVLGGLLLFRWSKLVWLHLPCAVWGALIEFRQWICPLTYLENALLQIAGESGYTGGFVQYYLLAVIYPQGLSRELQIFLGVFVVLINACIYAVFLWKRGKEKTG